MKRIETKALIKKIALLAEERLQAIDLELYAIEYRKESDAQVLRIFVDRESGVDLNVCAEATRSIKNLVEENDIDYDLLEVSSPGLDRLLTRERDFQRFNGSKIKIKTKQVFNGSRKLAGILRDCNEKAVEIEKDQQLILIPREIISSIRLDPEE